MIKHHPTFELIQSYVNGDLPASLSAGISIHAEMCPKCQQHISQLTEQIAAVSFEEDSFDIEYFEESSFEENSFEQLAEAGDFKLNIDEMVSNITQSKDITQVVSSTEKCISFNNKKYTLPRALNNMQLDKPVNIGKLSRARIQLSENEIHTSLLKINPGGGVPQHTHNGFELTLLLDGSFHDEQGEYHKGDFIMLDGSHQHNPVSDQGCLCFTVANGALHFTQGINKLLNPIGSFIY
ncbi:ChrR family anti-sigma-E factor [Paraglaciecola aquimarina]|uniref:ChrR family anti-sigma-E factor n=1 Tax=Paraglaciecola algarum TaxID=3050085 RepID=A0ABS9DA54_9ALTE|nr:ChrR family anti-sigma-E factor [Paraglaciecola sp. G1-23]MCF2949798.1 ChrR family anti-sigma-E factor [Paraglaciecola sp. G1-23]